jgi:hypothetical protein
MTKDSVYPAPGLEIIDPMELCNTILPPRARKMPSNRPDGHQIPGRLSCPENYREIRRICAIRRLE